MNYKPVPDIYNDLYQILTNRQFLEMDGLGNEIPFFIQPYDPKHHLEMIKVIGQLKTRLENEGIRIVHINLYNISIELIKERGIWEEILTMEESITKAELKELLQGILDPESHIIRAISEKIEGAEEMSEKGVDICFLSGVGEVFPYIRSHTILNNLQSTIKNQPLVMFFPGRYRHSLESGASLDLFDMLHDDKYYRAFNLDKMQT